MMRYTQLQVTMTIETDRAGLEVILLLLASVIHRMWQLRWSITRRCAQVRTTLQDLTQAIEFAGKVLTIITRSLAYGVVGV